MGYLQVSFDSRIVNYDRTGFIRLTTLESIISVRWPDRFDLSSLTKVSDGYNAGKNNSN